MANLEGYKSYLREKGLPTPSDEELAKFRRKERIIAVVAAPIAIALIAWGIYLLVK